MIKKTNNDLLNDFTTNLPVDTIEKRWAVTKLPAVEEILNAYESHFLVQITVKC